MISRSAAAGLAARASTAAKKDCGEVVPAHDRPPSVRSEYRSSGAIISSIRETQADRHHQHPEQAAAIRRAFRCPGADTELRPDDAADHQDEREHGVDELVGRRMHHRSRGHGDEGQHHGGADHGRGRYAQE